MDKMEHNLGNINESMIISYLNGEQLADVENQEVERWLESDLNQLEAREIYKTWELSILAKPSTVDSGLAFEKLSGKMGKPEEVKNTPVVSINRWWYSVAAAVILLMVAAWQFWPVNDGFTLQSGLSKVEHVLEDKSIITLKENSSLTYDKSEITEKNKNREVVFAGEAYFEIERIPERPFIVNTKDVKIEVLGTKFLVVTYEDKPTKVLVTEGKVKVTYLETGEVYILTAAEEIEAQDDKSLTVVASDENQLFWKTGTLDFPGTSISEVIETLEKEFDREISVENEKLLSCSISAKFKKQSLNTIIEVLTSTLNLQYEIKDDVILIKGDDCQ